VPPHSAASEEVDDTSDVSSEDSASEAEAEEEAEEEEEESEEAEDDEDEAKFPASLLRKLVASMSASGEMPDFVARAPPKPSRVSTRSMGPTDEEM